MYIRKVLVVDGDQHTRDVATVSLQDIGRWAPLVASSADDAIRTARQERPDVILIGEPLDNGNAAQLVGMLRSDEDTAKTPVILLVGLRERLKTANDRAYQLGACGIVRKPFNPTELPAEIRRCTGADDGPNPAVFFRGR